MIAYVVSMVLLAQILFVAASPFPASKRNPIYSSCTTNVYRQDRILAAPRAEATAPDLEDDMIAWPDYRKRGIEAAENDEKGSWLNFGKREEASDDDDEMVAWPDYRLWLALRPLIRLDPCPFKGSAVSHSNEPWYACLHSSARSTTLPLARSHRLSARDKAVHLPLMADTQNLDHLHYGYSKANLAVAIVFGLCVMAAWASVHGGLGVPQDSLSPDETWAQELISTPAIGLIKISVCLFYKRIFSTRKFKTMANIMIAAAVAWTIAFTSTLAFNLIPFPLEWALTPNRPHNLNFAAMLIAMGSTDLLLDLIILSMPIPVIKNLHMPTHKKIMIGGMFGLGGFCIISSTIRLTYIIKFIFVYGTDDAFSVCACLPSYGPFFRMSFDKNPFFASIKSFASKLSLLTRTGRLSSRDPATYKSNNESTHASCPDDDEHPIQKSPMAALPPIMVQTDITVSSNVGESKDELTQEPLEWGK
ncbi:hypothetical protein FH972_023629 [Carpinus fangiana]|uniref:Rhodopsin domain-containing protein n=1 Tax=Carpinus fangiana TaxID=176857 RepID=A0A5N6KW42_9ROSI|nr:hypothetical protein FH972_023629 [Carpinus fangiana]